MPGSMRLIATQLTGTGVKSSSLVHWFYMGPCQDLLRFGPTGSALASRLSEAIREHALHHAFFLKLSSGLDGLDPKIITEWEELATAWEDDQMKPSPFEELKNRAYILYSGENEISY